MTLLKRLNRLEQNFKLQFDGPRVFIVVQDSRKDYMEIPALNFTGSIIEGRQLLSQYNHCTVIIDDIPRWVD